MTLNINNQNTPVLRKRLSEWMKTQEPTICCQQEIHFKYKDIYKLKVKGWRKHYRANTN